MSSPKKKGEEGSGRSRRPSRSAKKTEHFTYEVKEKKKLETGTGSGITLGDIPSIQQTFKKTVARDPCMRQLHLLMYNRVGKQSAIKQNILKFNGFGLESDEDKESNADKLATKMAKYSLANLKKIYDVLTLSRSSTSFEDGKQPTKDTLINRLANWLNEPTEDLLVATKPKKAKASRKRKSAEPSSAKKKTQSKKKRTKKEDPEITKLKKAIKAALDGVDLETTSLGKIRKMVSAETGLDLKDRKNEFKQLVSDVLND